MMLAASSVYAAPFAYVVNTNSTTTNPGTVSVIDIATNTVTATIAVGLDPSAIAITPDGTTAYVANSTGNSVSVLALGTNTVVATIPVTVPAGGDGPLSLQTFSLIYSDAYGASSLAEAGVIFNSEPSSPYSCTVLYAPSSNVVYLVNDTGTGSTTLTPGSGSISNSQCTINGSGTSVTSSGNNLTLNLAVTASATFTGLHDIFMYAKDVYSAEFSWVNKGAWLPAANQPPTIVSASPTPATGLSNTFVLTYSDPNGATDLYKVGAIFGASSSTYSNSCVVLYVPAANLLYLVNDAGTGSSSITPGSGTLSNSQCSIAGSGVSVIRSGNTLTLTVDVTASAAYTATQNIFMLAEDNSTANAGWVNEGSWTP